MLFSYIILAFLLWFFVQKPSKAMIFCSICYPTLSLFSISKIPIIFLFIIFASCYKTIINKKFDKETFPFMLVFGLSILSYTISYCFGETLGHHNAYISNIIIYVFVLLLWYFWPLNPLKHVKFFYNTLFVYLVILSAYGIYGSITGENQFIHYLYNIGMIELDNSSTVRFGFYRSQSFTLWFETYAATCGMGLIFIWASISKKIIKANYFVIFLSIMLIASLVSSGSRSMMLMTIVMSLGIIPKLSSNVRVLFILVPLLVGLFYAQEKLMEEVADSIINQNQFQGSSTEMREGQLKSTLKFWRQAPIIGHGLGYIGEATKKDATLWGGESIVFFVLIDRGSVGFLTLLYMLVVFSWYFYKKGRFDIFFIIIGFFVGKVLTMLPAMGEVYVLIYAIPLYKFVRMRSMSYSISNNQKLCQL